MGKGIFVTGTGTDIGKTYVTALIVKNWQMQESVQGIIKRLYREPNP